MKASTTSRTQATETGSKLADLLALVKFRLSATVVLSSILAYLVALPGTGINWWAVGVLTGGGFLTTAAANILNEILEKDYDRQMARTSSRPLVTGRMNSSEALLIAGFSTLGGITLLALFNPWTAILGMISLVSYAFVYTPLKRVGPVAVVVGAVPGALPALIGCAAAEGVISGLGITLFTIQFFWQLPHFYAIGYLGSKDYTKAGFRLVPERDGAVDARTLGRDALTATAVLIPLSTLPYWLGVTTLWATLMVVACGILFLYYAMGFYRRPDRSTALRMMFFSFAYLPVIFTAYWAGKFFM